MDAARLRMNATNPVVIPRNHRIEQAIQAAVQGDLDPTERLLAALAQPFTLQVGYEDLSRPPEEQEQVLRTFCGT